MRHKANVVCQYRHQIIPDELFYANLAAQDGDHASIRIGHWHDTFAMHCPMVSQTPTSTHGSTRDPRITRAER
jgi:hypothetical protein